MTRYRGWWGSSVTLCGKPYISIMPPFSVCDEHSCAETEVYDPAGGFPRVFLPCDVFSAKTCLELITEPPC